MGFVEKMTEEQKKILRAFIKERGRTKEEVLRAQGLLLLEEKVSNEMIEALTSLKRATLVKLRKKFLKQGIEAIASKRPKKKTKSLLTKAQREEIKDMLHNETPQNYGWNNVVYWSTTILGALILQLYGVKYKSKSSLYVIFKQSKFTAHLPTIQYEKRNQKLIDEWKATNKKEIEEALQDPNTVVITEDEMIITSQTTTQRVWLPQGAVVNIECSNTRKRKSIYGFLNIKTGEEFAFKSDRQTSVITAGFLKEIVTLYKDKKILLLWDNAPWHYGEAMRKFLETCTNLRIINYPPYAPEENPQEHVWKSVRSNVTHNTFIPDIHKTVKNMLLYLNNTTFKYLFFGFMAS